MKKKLITIVIGMLLFVTALSVTGNSNNNYGSDCRDDGWSQTYGGSYDDVGYSLQQTSDGGYIIVGYTRSYGAGLHDAWLIKTDAVGNEEWNETFGGTHIDRGNSVQQTGDGGYIVAGTTYTTDHNAWLIKTDDGGNELWSQTYGGDGVERGNAVLTTADNGYILIGETNSYGAGYIITGYTGSFGSGDKDVWLIKTDAVGNELWNKTFGGAEGDVGESVQQTSDGGYIINGYTGSFGSGDKDVWLIKTDAVGNELWNKTFGGNLADIGYSVQQISDGGYVFAGTTKSFSPSIASHVWIVKTDQDGNELGNMTLGEMVGHCVQQTMDEGFIIAGYGTTPGNRDDVRLIKIPDVSDNKLPVTPDAPQGPDEGDPGQEYEFSAVTTDPDFNVMVKARDAFGESGWSSYHIINITNEPPGDPGQPNGPTLCFTGIFYTYNTAPVTDPDGDVVQYLFDWGDDTNSGWTETPSASKNWTIDGVFQVRVKAKDTYQQTDWSSPLDVTVYNLQLSDIRGGSGIKIDIENAGETLVITNINWSISIDGGFYIKQRNESGTIESLGPGESEEISMSVFGIGLGILTDIPTITVTVCDGLEKSATARIVLKSVKLL